MNARSIASLATLAFAVVAFVSIGTNAAFAKTPIAPQQHFAGIVNGKEGSAVVYTVCPGTAKHRTGPVEKGQTMAVAQVASRHGDTGPFSQVYSWFQPVPSGKRPVMLEFTRYGEAKGIPGTVRVPCDGSGKAVFSSCPYLAPCAAGFVPDTVQVTFENKAASGSRRGR
jgi:hypothetical protein